MHLLANCFVEFLDVLSVWNLTSGQQNHDVIQRSAHSVNGTLVHLFFKLLETSTRSPAWTNKRLTRAYGLVGGHHVLERLADHELFLFCTFVGQ